MAVGPAGDIYWPGEYGLGGMFLRDWLAAQALFRILGNTGPMPEHGGTVMLAGLPTEAIVWAYKIADAMIKQRSAS
jgi:hypothetical protein